jgi:hypothetical protein
MAEYQGGTPFKPPTGPQGVSKGYDIEAARLHGSRREEALEHRNALLHDGSGYVEFYCNGIEFNQALAGKTVQSKNVRDFYAHNIQIPPMMVRGQCLDQEDYGTVVEFIHQAQRNSLGGSLIELTVDGHGSDLTQGDGNVTLKGAHKPFKGHGYIPKMPRKHERFVYAPEFQFQFIVVTSLAGLYTNIISEEPAERTWLEIMSTLTQQKPKREEAEAQGEEKAGEFVGKLGDKLKKVFENGF